MRPATAAIAVLLLIALAVETDADGPQDIECGATFGVILFFLFFVCVRASLSFAKRGIDKCQ